MSISLSPLPQISPHAHPQLSMSLLRTITSLPLHRSNRRLFSRISAAVRQPDTTLWTPSPISRIEPAAESLFHVSIDVSDSEVIASSHMRAGQYVQLKVPDSPKPSFLAIASPPSLASRTGELQFLVKSVAGSTAELLCSLTKGDVVELTPAMGNGFDVDQISPPHHFPTVLIFATGSGIRMMTTVVGQSLMKMVVGMVARLSSIHAAIVVGRPLSLDRFIDWESSGVKIVPVLSQPDEGWTGEVGYVQAAFCRSKNVVNPNSTGVVLCGQKQMTEVNYVQWLK
ncbi:hypothetical protein RDABS01_003455 [Bienertia sinuspersici]